MSGHDIADEPHETTHEMVWDISAPGGASILQTTDERGPDVRFIFAVQWTRWPNVKPREAAERRSGPRNNWSTTR